VSEGGAQVKFLRWIQQSSRRILHLNKAVEPSKKRSAEQMAALLEILPDNYFRIDEHGTVLDYSIGMKPSMLNDPFAYLGCNMADLTPVGIRDLFNKNLKKYLETHEIVAWEYSLMVEGERRVRAARFCPIEGTDEIIYVARDITKRRRAEKQRNLVEARLERIITNLPGAVLRRKYNKSSNAEVVFVSPQSEKIWGYTPEEIYAKQGLLEDALHPDDRHNLNQLWVNANEKLEPYSCRLRITSRSGEHKWVETHTSAYRHEDGTTFTDGIILDVTAEVETQQQLDLQKEIAHQTQKLESIGQLTGGVAHDFNNLLAAVMGSLELLRDNESDPEQLFLIDAGITAAKRGADLTRNMLAFASKASLVPSIINLNALVNGMQNWAGHALPASISVETALLAELWSIEVDVSSIESALLNLIVNARDAMPEGGTLTIETNNLLIDETTLSTGQETLKPGRYVTLTVKDTGHGIPAETLDHIFDPFFSTKAPGAGTGLGLSMILGFMRQSGGSVEVQSKLNFGTTFKLFFKASTVETDETLAEQDQTELPMGKGQKILVAEDDKDVLPILVTTLEKAGYSVTAAGSGDEAFAVFKKDPTFDLVLTDIVMPGSLQGPALSQAILEQVADIPFIFMSGYASETSIIGFQLRQEDIRLMKPVRRGDLLAAISKSLNG